MTYWISMASVLLVGYGLVKWSGRANAEENEGVHSLGYGVGLGNVGIRATSKHTLTDQADNEGKNAGNNGGEA
jgi:hypothetical protein